MNFKELFSFNKQEKRGIVVLLILILVVAILPDLYRMYFVDGCSLSNLKNEDKEESYANINNKFESSGNSQSSGKKEGKGRQPQKEFKVRYKQSSSYRSIKGRKESNNILSDESQKPGFRPAKRKQSTFRKNVVQKNASNSNSNKWQTHKINSFKKHKETVIKIELNAADTTELKKVYGIGSWYARKIVRYRERLGGFFTVEQLKEIRMREGTYERIAPQLYTDTTNIRKLNLDTIGFKNLLRHPYFDYDMVKKVFNLRRDQGSVTLKDLLKQGTISQEQFIKIRKYCKKQL